MLQFGSKVLTGILLCVLALTVHLSRVKIDASRSIHFVDMSPQFLPRGKVLKWLSMGYRGMAADILWIKTVLYYGRRTADEDNPYYVYAQKSGSLENEMKDIDKIYFDADTVFGVDEKIRHNLIRGESRGLINHIYPLLDRITTLDPHFKLPYFFGGIHLLMDTGEINKSYNLLKKGYKSNPEEWRFAFYLGWVDWMYKGNTRSAQKYMSQAVGLPGCPTYVNDLFVGLTRNLGRSEMTKYYLQGLLESTKNKEIREQLLEVLDELSK